MTVVIRVADRARARAFLVRHSPGTALPNNTFVVSEAAVRGLRDAGIEFTEVSRDGEVVGAAGTATSERI